MKNYVLKGHKDIKELPMCVEFSAKDNKAAIQQAKRTAKADGLITNSLTRPRLFIVEEVSLE